MSNQITRLSGDGWFDVAYDDGTFEKNVPRCRILRVTGTSHSAATTAHSYLLF